MKILKTYSGTIKNQIFVKNISVKIIFSDIFFSEVFMNTNIRLQAKYLLSKNNLRLFAISLASFCLRWGRLILTVVGMIIFLKSPLFQSLTAQYGVPEVSVVCALIYGWFFFLTALVSAGFKMGEQFIYFTRAQGSRGSLRLLFKYASPKKAFRALRFYTTLNFFKALWLIYFLVPCALCIICDAYIYSNYQVASGVHIVIALSLSLLLSISLAMWRASVARYCAAVYYFCLNPSIRVLDAIKKSIRFTDGLLIESVLLEYSLLGWVFSCIYILPMLYVVPYIKLCKCVFITNMLIPQNRIKEGSMAITYLSGQHIN